MSNRTYVRTSALLVFSACAIVLGVASPAPAQQTGPPMAVDGDMQSVKPDRSSTATFAPLVVQPPRTLSGGLAFVVFRCLPAPKVTCWINGQPRSAQVYAKGGTASAVVEISSPPGTVSVQATSGASSYVFTLTVLPAISATPSPSPKPSPTLP